MKFSTYFSKIGFLLIACARICDGKFDLGLLELAIVSLLISRKYALFFFVHQSLKILFPQVKGKLREFFFVLFESHS
jgi:hypothetical protein